MSKPETERRGVAALWTAVVAACVVCCAGPVLAVLAALGLTAAVAAVFIPALAVVAAAAWAAVWWLRHRRTHREDEAKRSPDRVVIAAPALRPYADGPPAVGPQRSAESGDAALGRPPAKTEAR
jgi:hypothetical protein